MSGGPAPRLVVDARRESARRVAFSAHVENAGDAPWEHTLPTSARSHAEARTARGVVVYDSAAGFLFLQVLTPLRVDAGGRVALAEDAFDAPEDPVTLTVRVPRSDLQAVVEV